MKKNLLPFLIFALLVITYCSKRSKKVSSSANNASPEIISKITQQPLTEKWPPVTQEKTKDLLQENYLVVLDDSGSMSGDKLKEAKQALFNLCSTLQPKHNLGLLCFNSPLSVPLRSKNRENFKTILGKVKASGGTPLTKATRRGIQSITQQASKQKGYGAYHLIIVTDGESSDGNPIAEVQVCTLHTAIQVHVIGFHLDSHSLNIPGYVDYKSAKNASELAQAFKEVSAETNNFSDPTEFTR